MERQDANQIENSSNRNPGRVQVCSVSIADNGLSDGIVRMVKEDFDGESTAKFYTAQEHHNANHALHYFNMLVDSIICGRDMGRDIQKLERIKEHMKCLREFVGEDRSGLQVVIRALLEEIEKFYQSEKKEFAPFIYNNWLFIRFFAAAYGHQDRCFSQEECRKIRDIVRGRFYLKLWWWKTILKKFRQRVKKIIRQVTK